MRTGVVETPLTAWKAVVLPLYDVRVPCIIPAYQQSATKNGIEIGTDCTCYTASMRPQLLILFVCFFALLIAFDFAVQTIFPETLPSSPVTSTPPVPLLSTKENIPQDPEPPVVATTTKEQAPRNTKPQQPLPAPESTPQEGTTVAVPRDILPVIPATLSFSAINEDVRTSLVNILCTTKSAGPLRPISGSGVFIDPRGVILTNAHVAQYFLLKDYPVKDFVECAIRTGSPAVARYTARVLYLPPSWIENHADAITLENPVETGEDDYALLLVTGVVNPQNTLPPSFPYTKPDASVSTLQEGVSVLVGGYPAGFLDGVSIQTNLYSLSTVATVRQIFTFANETIDLFSLGGSIVAQKGSSGGAVVSNNNSVVGIVVTSTVGETTESRDLRAITMAHIDRSIAKYGKGGLSPLLSDGLEGKVREFDQMLAQKLRQILIDQIEK